MNIIKFAILNHDTIAIIPDDFSGTLEVGKQVIANQKAYTILGIADINTTYLSYSDCAFLALALGKTVTKSDYVKQLKTGIQYDKILIITGVIRECEAESVEDIIKWANEESEEE